jgi:hypothetical protein
MANATALQPGFYWIRFLPDASNHGTGWLPAEYSGPCDDGSPNESPWSVVGSDDVYGPEGIEVGPRIEPPG